jgi:hypothetical protein
MPQPDNTRDRELGPGERQLALPPGPVRAALMPGESTTGRFRRAGRAARAVASGLRRAAAGVRARRSGGRA